MNNLPECIITGCVLYALDQEKFAYGDLHRIGDCLIFNATVDRGETQWFRDVALTQDRRIVTVNSNAFFERRAVIVFSVKHTAFNETARKYLSQ